MGVCKGDRTRYLPPWHPPQLNIVLEGIAFDIFLLDWMNVCDSDPIVIGYLFLGEVGLFGEFGGEMIDFLFKQAFLLVGVICHIINKYNSIDKCK